MRFIGAHDIDDSDWHDNPTIDPVLAAYPVFAAFQRLLGRAAAALERAEVGDADEAAAILSQVVTLDGHYVR